MRYLAHLRAALGKTGKAAEFRTENGGGVSALAAMVSIAVRAHIAVLMAAGRVWRQRSFIRRTARVSAGEFTQLLAIHSTTAGEIARH